MKLSLATSLMLLQISLPLGLGLLTLALGLPLLRLAEDHRGWTPPVALLEAFGRWLGLLQLLPLLLSLALLPLLPALPSPTVALGGGEAFGLGLTFRPLAFFFALMAQLVLVLTDLNFRCSPLEERLREENGGGRRRHRARRGLVFGLSLALLQLLLLLFFYSDNLLVFFGAFETSVLPIFLLMGFFGKRSQKFRAMAYLLFFTLLSALPLLLLLLELYRRSGTVDYPSLLLLQQRGQLLTPAELPWAFLAFFLPFGVKMAAFPLHGWLPEAHVEASTEGSMLLSGVLLKVGLYGLLRCCLELCGGATLGLAPYLLTLALVGALLTSLSAYRQLDLKKIIAYSSVVHMNLSLVGCFCLSATALGGTLFLNFGHALVSAGLFAAVGVLQDRTRSRSLLELSGLERAMPLWSLWLLLLLLANAGLPGTVGFLGEAGLLWGSFSSFLAVGLLALPAVGLMGLRNLLLYAQLCWGVAPAFLGPLRLPAPAAGVEEGATPPEATAVLLLRHWDVAPWRDGLALGLLALLSLALGLWPQPLLLLVEEATLGLPEAGPLGVAAAAAALPPFGNSGRGGRRRGPDRRRRLWWSQLTQHPRLALLGLGGLWLEKLADRLDSAVVRACRREGRCLVDLQLSKLQLQLPQEDAGKTAEPALQQWLQVHRRRWSWARFRRRLLQRWRAALEALQRHTEAGHSAALRRIADVEGPAARHTLEYELALATALTQPDDGPEEARDPSVTRQRLRTDPTAAKLLMASAATRWRWWLDAERATPTAMGRWRAAELLLPDLLTLLASAPTLTVRDPDVWPAALALEYSAHAVLYPLLHPYLTERPLRSLLIVLEEDIRTLLVLAGTDYPDLRQNLWRLEATLRELAEDPYAPPLEEHQEGGKGGKRKG